MAAHNPALPVGLDNSTDISYDSHIWEKYTASDVLIKPTVVSGEGIRALLRVTAQGISSAGDCLKEIEVKMSPYVYDQAYVQLVAGILKRKYHDEPELQDVLRSYEAGLHRLVTHCKLYETLAYAADNVYHQFRLIDRLGRKIQFLQNEYGEDLIKRPEAIARLMVGMKCLDAAWHEMREDRRAVIRMSEHLEPGLEIEVMDRLAFIDQGVARRVVRDNKNGPYLEVMQADGQWERFRDLVRK